MFWRPSECLTASVLEDFRVVSTALPSRCTSGCLSSAAPSGALPLFLAPALLPLSLALLPLPLTFHQLLLSPALPSPASPLYFSPSASLCPLPYLILFFLLNLFFFSTHPLPSPFPFLSIPHFLLPLLLTPANSLWLSPLNARRARRAWSMALGACTVCANVVAGQGMALEATVWPPLPTDLLLLLILFLLLSRTSAYKLSLYAAFFGCCSQLSRFPKCWPFGVVRHVWIIAGNRRRKAPREAAAAVAEGRRRSWKGWTKWTKERRGSRSGRGQRRGRSSNTYVCLLCPGLLLCAISLFLSHVLSYLLLSLLLHSRYSLSSLSLALCNLCKCFTLSINLRSSITFTWSCCGCGCRCCWCNLS